MRSTRRSPVSETGRRVELARLTVRQYRQAVSDVVGSFRGTAKWGDSRGLNGEYFGGRGFGRRDGATKRVDARGQFRFRDRGSRSGNHRTSRILDPLERLGPGARNG